MAGLSLQTMLGKSHRLFAVATQNGQANQENHILKKIWFFKQLSKRQAVLPLTPLTQNHKARQANTLPFNPCGVSRFGYWQTHYGTASTET